MTRAPVLALIPLPAAARAALAERYQLHEAPADGKGAVPPWERIEAVVTNGTTGLTARQMAQMPALRICCAFGVGYEGVDTAAAAARGIVVTNAPNTNAETVADHALGFMLSLSRDYAGLTAAVRSGGWNGARAARPTLSGATLGIIGMGSIGQAIARRAQGFGMHIRYHARHARGELPYEHMGELLSMAAASDYLVAACPGGPATRHIVNAQVLRALGPQGFFVNVARGSVVHTGDLIQALQRGLIAGAGLDVLETEPEVPPELLQLANVQITPHVAGRSPVAQAAQTEALLASLASHFAGHRPALAVHA
ncbi:MAG: 2-hydroxyacid dehydrogenase [Proteobacteria bacterium]|nr:2-hydroxyacid dehydrogenase [Pseudomonadota bacterium]